MRNYSARMKGIRYAYLAFPVSPVGSGVVVAQFVALCTMSTKCCGTGHIFALVHYLKVRRVAARCIQTNMVQLQTAWCVVGQVVPDKVPHKTMDPPRLTAKRHFSVALIAYSSKP